MTEELSGLITADTKATAVPLTAVKVEGNIVSRGAKVKIIQCFKNGEDKPIEAVYKFPLPEGGAVCGFKAIIGEKIIEGDIEEREKAFELYDEALSKGHGAMLLDEERPNIFTLSVGNLNPGGTAIIEIEYVTLLEATGSEVRFFLPTTISPRYIPDGTPDDNGIPVDNQVNPVYSPDVPYGLSLMLTLHGKDGIESLDSPSHKIKTDFGSDPVRIEFSSETVKMDRDFVLNIKYKKGFENRGYIYRGNKGTFIQVDFCPGAEEFAATASNPASVMGKEVIFVLDCSGSMSGNSITEAKKALDVFLKGLEEGMRFNIYRFGSSFEKLLNESAPYTEETLDIMLKRLGNIDADLGGTEVLDPLKDIYD
ncbi:MAG: VIT domain-containing protein, partial [Nitrospira sp.]|nr:VIT domain-containing protein [Nitrospira sp.]